MTRTAVITTQSTGTPERELVAQRLSVMHTTPFAATASTKSTAVNTVLNIATVVILRLSTRRDYSVEAPRHTCTS